MEGIIFAAGLGTRLRPLTDDRPKAMVELGGKPLLEHVILKMRAAGVGRIVVNTHYFGEKIEEFLREHHYLENDVVISDERDCLLDTGGALLKARELFTPGESVLIHNVDALSNIDLKAFIDYHEFNKNYASLVTQVASPERGLRFNAEGVLKGWGNRLTGKKIVVDEGFYDSQSYEFCGIHIVSPELLENIEHQGVFSIIKEYLFQAKQHALKMYLYDGYFLDLGTPEAIAAAEKQMASL